IDSSPAIMFNVVVLPHPENEKYLLGYDGLIWRWPVTGTLVAGLHVAPVLLSDGDSFGFTITELEAAIRQRLPFVAVVANDSSWGIVTCSQRNLFGEEGIVASRSSEIRFDEVAKAFGTYGIKVEESQELQNAIAKGFLSNRPTVLNVLISLAGPFV
ncbi:MAG: thiamine pyrophosphate-dependent enzyme, partial [Nitrososphaeria archaeon]